MRASDQELAKGNEVFKLPQVQPRAKQVAGQTVRSRRIIADDREDISAKPILSYFSRQAHPLGGVVRERSSRPVIVEISEGISGSEIDVAVHSRDLVTGNEPAWWARILSLRRRSPRKGGRPRCRWQCEYVLRRHGLAAWSGVA